VKFNRKDLDNFVYSHKDEVRMLIPYVMINVGSQLYGELNGDVEFSVSCLWSIVTKNKKSLPKRERENLINLFSIYLNKTITYDESIYLGKYDELPDFITVSLEDITKIFITNSFGTLGMQLAILLNVQSYFNGKYIYKKKNDVILELCKVHESQIDYNNPKTWFYGMTYQELKEIANKITAYPNIDDLITKRYNADKVGNDEYITRKNFSNHINKLEDLGVVCKIQTSFGQYGKKTVFCRVEHKEIVIALYERLELLKDMAKEFDEEPRILQKPENCIDLPKRKRPVFK
jgi:hypothetical protein